MRGVAPSRLITLCVLCLCVSLVPVDARASEPLAVQLDSPADLSSRWTARQGDDPSWAAPDIDETAWQPVDLHAAWGQDVAAASGGYTWYRTSLALPAGAGDPHRDPLGVAFGPLQYGGYEVFANGVRIGATGSSEANPVPVPGRAAVFEVPANAIGAGGRLVLAVRLWRNAEYTAVARGESLDSPGPFEFGNASVLRDRAELASARRRFDTLPRVVLSIVFFLVGLYHIQLFRRRRQVSEYLWFGLIAIGAASSIFFNSTWTDGLLTPLTSTVIALVAMHATAAAWFEFVYSMLGWRAGRWVRAYEAFQAVMIVLTITAPRFTTIQMWPFNLVTLLPVVGLWVFVIPLEAWRGNASARTILIGLLCLAFSRVYQLLAILGAVPPVNFAHWGFFALLFSMAVSLSNRFSHVYAELDVLNQDLEAVVARRTAELADTVAQLRISEQQAVSAREAALDASRAKSTFLASMSHELRTPLNAILGFVQLIRRDATLSGERREQLGIIQRSGEHLLSLINGILSISKIEAGQESLREHPFSVRALLTSLDELFRLRAESLGLQFALHISPGVPDFVMGDDSKIRQILINMLGNAIKFTQRGSITLTADWSAGRATFEVSDTGRGIAARELDVLFEPFIQTGDDSADTEGTGLGLAISRHLARLMGGDITVSSELGRGSAFRVVVPLALTESAPDDERRASVVGLEPDQPECRVLVVDDSPTNRALLRALMSTVGFDAREAADGRDAVRVWQEWRPHLVWMDVRMPDLDGFEATREIRRLEANGNGDGSPQPTRIVALTASAFDSDRDELLAAGCDDFVLKPFREEVLFDVMARLLGVRFRYRVLEADRRSPVAAARAHQHRIAALPADLVAALDEAVHHGDLGTASEVIAAIRPHDEALADELSAMLKGYRLDDIQDALGASRVEHDSR